MFSIRILAAQAVRRARMIATMEDAWQHAKMAIGHIHDDELGDLWGVIADSIVGKLLAGENLIIMGTDPTGKKTLFRVDGSGMYAYNSRFWMESTNGGAFAIDPSFGLGLGQGNPFTVGDDGTIVPKCIDPKTGELRLDKDGFPVGMNLWAGMDGQVYIRGNVYATDGVFNGTVYATDGEFKGIVKATDFQTKDGTSMLTKDGKFDSQWLDLMGINIQNKAGDTVFSITENGIRWSSSTSPIKYQFGVAATGPWHDTMQANDKYRRDSLDGGTTWGEPYQFKGEDGKNGRPGTVDYTEVNRILKETYGITETYITEGTIGSPVIQGAKIYGCNIYAGTGDGFTATMDGRGFYLHNEDIETPKIALESYNKGTVLRLLLGSGSRDDDDSLNRGQINKSEHGMNIFYRDSNGTISGFGFAENGIINVMGKLNVNAVWAD